MKRFTSFLILAVFYTVLPAQELTKEMVKLADDLYDAVNKGRQEDADAIADKYLALCTKEDYCYGPYLG